MHSVLRVVNEMHLNKLEARKIPFISYLQGQDVSFDEKSQNLSVCDLAFT